MSCLLIPTINLFKGEPLKQMVESPSDGDATDAQSNGNKDIDGNESFHSNASNDEETSDGEIQFQPNTSPFLQPIDSKIDIRLFEDETTDANQFFSPPDNQFRNNSIPSHFRTLDPDLYATLSKSSKQHFISNSSERKSDAGKQTKEIHSQTLNYMLSTMHLYFPGNCHFVCKFFYCQYVYI